MIEASRKTLELFIEKAEHLKYLAVSTNNFGGLIGIVRDSDQQRWRYRRIISGLEDRHFGKPQLMGLPAGYTIPLLGP